MTISAPETPAQRRSLVARFAYGRDGRLHTARLLSGVAVAVALLSLATFAGLLMAGAGGLCDTGSRARNGFRERGEQTWSR